MTQHTKKKRNGWQVLCPTILSLSLLAACTTTTNGSSSSFKPGTTYSNLDGLQVVAYDAGSSYSISADGNVSIEYNSGKSIVQTPLTVDMAQTGTNQGLSQSGFFLSEDKTAIVYNPKPDQLSPIHVLMSDDKGKTWIDIVVDDAKGSEFFVGFTSKKDGWLVSGHSSGVGRAFNNIFQTEDGGETWEEIGNPNETYSEHLTGVGFSSKDIGFLGFRYYSDAGPEIYWTKDKGKSWEKLTVTLPEKCSAYNKTPLSPTFIGKDGTFPILLTDHSGTVGTIYLRSSDGGLTWAYSEKDDKLVGH